MSHATRGHQHYIAELIRQFGDEHADEIRTAYHGYVQSLKDSKITAYVPLVAYKVVREMLSARNCSSK